MKNKMILMVLIIVLMLSGCIKTVKENDIEKENTDPEKIEKEVAINISKDEFVTIAASVLNIREEPNTTSKVLGKTVEGLYYKTKNTIKDEEGKNWYEIDYKGNKGYLAGWYCADNMKINIDLMGYSEYKVMDTKWLDKDVIILIKHEEKEIFKLIKYNYEMSSTKEFYTGDKKVWDFRDAKNLEDNRFAVCLADRVLVFNSSSLELIKESVIQVDTETKENLVTDYDILFDGSILYVANNNIIKRNLDNDEEQVIYNANIADEETRLISPRWSKYGTKISSILMGDEGASKLLIMNNEGNDVKQLEIKNAVAYWLDDKYLFDFYEDKGFIINSASGKEKEILLSKYIDDMERASITKNSSMVALYNKKSVNVITDVHSLSVSKYSIKDDLSQKEAPVIFNQIGNKIVGAKANKQTVWLYILELYQ